MSAKLKVKPRTKLTRPYLKRLRDSGYVPGILYGKDVEAQPFEVEQGDLAHLLRTKGRHAMVEVEMEGRPGAHAMIHELQIDPIDGQILHVDLHQVRMDEKVDATVPLRFVGTPRGVRDGGILQQQLDTVEVRGLPKDLPAAIEVDISDLEIGDSLRAGALSLPSGLELRHDPEDVILSIVPPVLTPVSEDQDGDKERSGNADPRDGEGTDAAQ